MSKLENITESITFKLSDGNQINCEFIFEPRFGLLKSQQCQITSDNGDKVSLDDYNIKFYQSPNPNMIVFYHGTQDTYPLSEKDHKFIIRHSAKPLNLVAPDIP